jgi:hypothetical protein
MPKCCVSFPILVSSIHSYMNIIIPLTINEVLPIN